MDTSHGQLSCVDEILFYITKKTSISTYNVGLRFNIGLGMPTLLIRMLVCTLVSYSKWAYQKNQGLQLNNSLVVFFENGKYQLSKGRFTLRTMKSDHGRWTLSMVRVHGLTSMVRLHKKLVLRVLGPSLGVNRMWTKKSDHAPKIEGAHFFNTCPKRAILKKIRV
jgi:hypothetical protein